MRKGSLYILPENLHNQSQRTVLKFQCTTVGHLLPSNAILREALHEKGRRLYEVCVANTLKLQQSLNVTTA